MRFWFSRKGTPRPQKGGLTFAYTIGAFFCQFWGFWMPVPLTTKAFDLLNAPVRLTHKLHQVCGLTIQHITNLLQRIHGQVFHRTHADCGNRRRTDARLFCQFLLGHPPQGKHHFDFELYHRFSPLSFWVLYHAFRSKSIRKTEKYFDFRKRNYDLRIDKLRFS